MMAASQTELLLELHNGNGSVLDDIVPSRLAEEAARHFNNIQQDIMRNWTAQMFEMEHDLLRRPAWRGIVMALYISVILVGMIGNSIVVYVVIRNKNMQTVTNIFIANLALSDIGLCVFSLPLQLYYQITDQWIFGEPLCKVIFAAFAIPLYASTLTILLIAFDRYWLIVYPLRDRMSVRTSLILIGVSILISIIFSIPIMFFTNLINIDEPDIHLYRAYCFEEWPSKAARKVYSFLVFLLQFCLPLCMTALLYFRIYSRLRMRPAHRVQSAHAQERKKKTNKILIAIVTLFIICWLPWNLFSLVAEMDHMVVMGPHFKFVDLLLKVFAMGSACINPFLYCWLNDNFRKELDCMAIKLHICRQPSARDSRNNQGGMPHFRLTPPSDGNGNPNADPYGNVTFERLSTAQTSIDPVSTFNPSAV